MKGLTSEEAARLLRQYGLNVIAEKRQRPFLKKLFEQFNNFLIILLLFASLVSFFLGQVLDGWLILIIVVLNAAFGLYQEGKAEQAVLLLKKMAVTKTRVFRDGVEQEIESTALVPGDIILVEEGDKIPADGVLVAAHNLELNESALTGESLPIPKDSKEKVFMGTIIAKGRGRVKVEETGMHTEFGKITAHLAEIERVKSPLEKRLVALSRTIGIVGIVISAVAFWLSYSLGNTIFSSFLLAVSLAVAVVPEGLPAVMTITLAIGVSEMAKKKAIIRKLSAIEALGSVTLIATDKTGTITSNKMEVVRIYVDQNEYHISKPPYLSNHPFAKMILDGVLCSTASLVYVHDPSTSLRASHGRHDVLGDPTEGALLLLAQKVGVFPDKAREEWETVDEASFDSITKRMAVRVRRGVEELVFVKGATESVLELSGKIFLGETEEAMSAKRLSEIRQTMDGWTEKGYRVLAFAFRKVERGENYVLSKLMGKPLTFLGMVAIHDPLRPEAKASVAKAKEAGIEVVMITGDNEKTAETIGSAAGILKRNDEILVGSQVDEYSDEELLAIIPKVKIFARITPYHKKRIVSLYQKLGHVVAVTGDGVNDAVALKQADVGVAMGLVGTDVAKETADMVITDDNFATIVNAVEEGRGIVKKLKNAVVYLFAGNFSEATSIVGALSLGVPNLLFPIQILYINLISDGFPALALSFSPSDEHVMEKPPQKELVLLERFDKRFILIIGIVGAALVLATYERFLTGGPALARTAAFSTLALIQLFIFVSLWLSHRPVLKNIRKLKMPIFLVAFLTPFLLQFLIVSLTSLGPIFRVVQIDPATYLLLVVVSSLVLTGAAFARKML